MFNFIDIYSFISVSVCVGMDPSALLFSGVCSAVILSKTNLTKRGVNSDAPQGYVIPAQLVAPIMLHKLQVR
jgi:hypothetical protein